MEELTGRVLEIDEGGFRGVGNCDFSHVETNIYEQFPLTGWGIVSKQVVI